MWCPPRLPRKKLKFRSSSLPFVLEGVLIWLMLFYLFTYTAVQHDFHIRLCSLRLTETGRVTYRTTLGTLPDHPGSPPGFSWIRVAQSFVFCVVFCRSMSFCLFSFDQPWYCLSSFYLQLLITSVLQNFWLLGAYLQAFLAIFPFCVILISVVGVCSVVHRRQVSFNYA